MPQPKKLLPQITVFLVTLILCSTALAADAESDDTWPRKFSAEGRDFTVYQPQVESWKGTDLEERIAVSVQTKASPDPVFGVMWIKARTDIDKSQRAVALQDIKVTKVNFPSEPGNQDLYKQLLEKNSSDALASISLDRLRASLTINTSEAKHKVDGLKNEPPEIVYSEKPAALVLIDGAGVNRETDVPGYLRVVNTRALIVLNKANGDYFLNVADHWYQSASLNGQWKTADPKGPVLESLNKIKAENSKDTDNFDKTPDATAVYSSTSPAELVQTKGSPQFQPIQETELLYVTNTPDNIFLYTADQSYYVTLSGRWFRSKSMKGPWKFIDADQLPHDFAKIPETHPKGEVLASVAGTPAAQEAAIANDIPQTATVDRSTAKIEVVYDGQPQFTPINGSTLYYASNTRTPVIRVGNAYYAVENGVWFSAPSPSGPWIVTSEVPEVIYTIPPSAPVYYVTYAYVYGADPQYVYVGYLPGYLGAYVAPSGVVVYGTGYYYHPWVNHFWYGYPVTYGFGFAWGFGFGWSFRPAFYGAPVYRPWWGPWPHYWAHAGPYGYGARNITVNHINIYHGWDRGMIRPTQVRSYSPRGMESAHMGAAASRNYGHVNNVYADHNGNVYRHEPAKGWQQYNSKQWQSVNNEHSSPVAHSAPVAHTNNTMSNHELDRERTARDRGASQSARYRPQQMAHSQVPHAGGGARAHVSESKTR